MKEPWEYWEDHCAEVEEYRSYLPICDKCRKPIDEDTYLEIDGEIYHKDCAMELFEKFTDRYVEEEKERRYERGQMR